MSLTLCSLCQKRPRYNDGTTLHPYCSKTCSAIARNNTTPTPTAGACDFCHVRPKRAEGQRIHDFCGKSCAQMAQSRTPSPVPAIPVSKNRVCIMCRIAQKRPDKSPNHHFCSMTCTREAEKKAPLLLEIPEDHDIFNDVANQFKKSWKHTNRTCPQVKRVYKVVETPTSRAQYDNYRDTIEQRGSFKQAGISPGNERRRWHGTTRACTLGDNSKQLKFCDATTCALCCIIKTSFDLKFVGKKTGYSRFGKGIYTSATSSKAADPTYLKNAVQSPFKAILLTKVVVGKGYKATKNDEGLVAPPAGHDSVIGEVGGALNYDELVVYDNHAIRPSYLVMIDA